MSDYENGLTDVPDYEAKRAWWDPPWKLYQWPPSWPVYVSGDEFARRTLVLHLPLLGRLVVAISRPNHYDHLTIGTGAIKEPPGEGRAEPGDWTCFEFPDGYTPDRNEGTT